MPLASLTEILREAQRGHYAVGYFESWNLESMQAVVEAAEEERSPVVIGVNGGLLNLSDPDEIEYYAAIGKVAARKASVPVALILNETDNFQLICRGIRYGFTCVMVDGAHLPFKDNIELTKKVVEFAHAVGVSVEAALGHSPRANEGFCDKKVPEDFMTKPDEAARFVEETNIDALAISIGNVHVMYEGKARIDFDRLKEIRRMVNVPLVIHGGTGFPDDCVRKAIQMGVCKFNVGTMLRLAFSTSMRKVIEEKAERGFPEDYLKLVKSIMKNLVKKKIRLYRSTTEL